MNTSTLRFGVARTAILTVVIAAAALYSRGAQADEFVPERPSVESAANLRGEVQATLKAQVATELAAAAAAHPGEMLATLRATQVDLLSKVAASALVAPRGFALAIPAALVQPTL
jgi:enhancing lycopene biosynthesis protein 2